MPLQDIPVGINIHNVEIQPGGGGKIARAAGSSVTISGLDGNYSLIKLASGEVRKIDSRALATIGILSNPDQKILKLVKQVDQDGWVEDLILEVLLKIQLTTHMEVVKENLLEEDIQFHLQDNLLKV